MLSVLRTPIRHLPTTISILLLGVVTLVVFVTQHLDGAESVAMVDTVRVSSPPAEYAGTRVRQGAAGPQGRKLPWVRWEYVP